MDSEQWVQLELTYRDDENILTRHCAYRKVKEIEYFFKENDLHMYEFDVTGIYAKYEINPLVSSEPKLFIQLIVRRY